MGNIGSRGGGHRRRRRRNHNSHDPPAPPPLQNPQPEITGNRYVSSSTIPNPPPPPTTLAPLPLPNDHHHHGRGSLADPANADGLVGRNPCGPLPPVPAPFVEHQKAVTIRNDVNLKRETLRVEPDVQNPGQFVVAFTFDATVSGSFTVIFFALEGEDCNLTPTKENLLKSVTVSFKQGLGQNYKQPSGTGIDFSMFEETELLKEGSVEIYPLAVKAEAYALDYNGTETGNPMPGFGNSQITVAVFEKDRGDYQAKVVKQILWVNGKSYELQEIYGIRSSVDCDVDGNDAGKECAICLSEPRDTTVLPCRHMCMCSGCAKLLSFQTNRCPICRQPVEQLLEIEVNNRSDA